MKTVWYVARRLVLLVPVLVGVTLITFALTRIFPGDPALLLVPIDEGPEAIERARERLGLDMPLVTQFWNYLRDVFSLDFGTSFRTGAPVLTDLLSRFPATVELALASLILALIIGIPLGIAAAVYRDRPLDHATRFISLLGVSMPQFWLGLLVIFFFFFHLGWLPAPLGRLPVGISPPEQVTGLLLVDSLIAGDLEAFGAALHHLVGPAATLAITNVAALAQITRTSMIEALQSQYILASRAAGIQERVVITRLAFRNAMLSVVTQIALLVGNLLGGAILVEFIFAWPGIGSYAVRSIQFLDYPAIQGFMILGALLYVVVFLITDILYFRIDPRIR